MLNKLFHMTADMLRTIEFSFRDTWKITRVRIPLFVMKTFFAYTIPFVLVYATSRLIGDLASQSINVREVVYSAVLLLSATVAQLVVDAVCSNIDKRIAVTAQLRAELRFKEKLVTLPLSFLDSAAGRDTIEQTAVHIEDVYGVVIMVVRFVAGVYALIIASISIFSSNCLFAFVLMLTTLPSALLAYTQTSLFDKYELQTRSSQRMHKYYRWMLTDKAAAPDVRLYNLKDPLIARYKKERKKYLTGRRKLKLHFAVLVGGLNTLQSGGLIAYIIFLVIRAATGVVSVENIVLEVGVATIFIESFASAVSNVDMIRWYSEMVKCVSDFYNMRSENSADSEMQSKVPIQFESIQFRDVFFKYPYSDEYALKGVSFTLHRGEKIMIVGPNGAGKSTILKLMIGLYPIERGNILLNDMPIQDFDLRDVRNIFSVLFQSYNIFPLSLRENVALSQIERADDDLAVIDALQKSDFQISDINDIDTAASKQFDDGGLELSGGQKQRLALARTYFKDAQVLIFDEPSSALDVESEDRIFLSFKNFTTAVMISHKLSASRFADKIFVVENGEIIESGTHTELMGNHTHYSQMYNLQKSEYNVSDEMGRAEEVEA
jgi:ABC-type multidrug transport system fused ATPase/permease subunit